MTEPRDPWKDDPLPGDTPSPSPTPAVPAPPQKVRLDLEAISIAEIMGLSFKVAIGLIPLWIVLGVLGFLWAVATAGG